MNHFSSKTRRSMQLLLSRPNTSASAPIEGLPPWNGGHPQVDNAKSHSREPCCDNSHVVRRGARDDCDLRPELALRPREGLGDGSPYTLATLWGESVDVSDYDPCVDAWLIGPTTQTGPEDSRYPRRTFSRARGTGTYVSYRSARRSSGPALGTDTWGSVKCAHESAHALHGPECLYTPSSNRRPSLYHLYP